MANKLQGPQPLKKVITRLLNTQWFSVSIIIILIILLASYFSGKNQIKSQQQSTVLLANSAGRYFENAENIIRSLAATNPSQKDLVVVQKSNPIFDAIYVIRSNGNLSAIAPLNGQLKVGMDMSGHPNFQDGLIRFILSKPFISPRTGKPTVYVSFPIINGGGILVGEFNLNGLEDNLSVMNLNQGINFYITDATGIFLSHPQYEMVEQQQNIGYLSSDIYTLHNLNEKVIRKNTNFYISIFAIIPQTGWYAITETSIFSVYGVILYPSIIGLMIIGLLYLMFVRREREVILSQVINPISELDRAALEISKGNFNANLEVVNSATFNEIINLASSFEFMQMALRNHTEELRKSEEKYRTVADFTYDWEAWRLPDGEFRYVSPSCERISGHKAEEFINHPDLIKEIVIPEDRPTIDQHYLEISNNFQNTMTHVDFRIRDTKGDIHWVSHWCAAVFGENGEFLGRRESNRDITDRKDKELELEKWGQIFENAEWGIVLGSADGIHTELMNPAFAKMHGFAPDQTQKMKIADYFAPECRADIEKNINLAHDKGHHVWHSRHIHKDGHTFPVSIDITSVKDDKGDIKFRVVNVQDLTERERIENELRLSEAKFSTAFKTSPDSININRMTDGLYIEINNGFTQLTQYEREEVIGKSSLEIDIWVNPDDRKTLVKGLLKDGIVNNLEAQFRSKNGQIKTCLMSASIIAVDGEKCILSITRDISDRIFAEAKLKESEEKFSRVFHEAPVWISITDFESAVYLDVNEEAINATGYSREEAIGHSAEEIGLFELGDRKKIIDELNLKGRVTNLEMTFHAKNGSLMYGILNAEQLMVNGRNCLLTIVNDITSRKQAEEQLELLKYSIDTSFDCAYWMDMDGHFIYANDAACRMLGYTHEELLALHVSTVNPKATPERWKQVCDQLKEKKNITIESTHQRKDGTIFPVELSSGYFKFGNMEYINGFAKDITERKLAEENLRESVEFFRASFDNANIGACLVDLNSKFISVNDELCNITGYSREELLQLSFNDITHPEDREIGWIYLQRMINKEIDRANFEKRYIHKSGKTIWVNISNSSVRDAHNEIKYCVTYIRDITEEKNIDEIIRESETNLRNAQKYAHIGSWVWDIKTNHLDWSDEMFKIFGLDKETFTGDLQDVIAKAIHPDDREKVEAINRKVIEEGKPSPIEYRINWHDGSTHVVWAEAGELILDENSAYAFLKGTVQDVTERKRLEEVLTKSEEKNRLLISQMHQGLAVHEIILDEKGNPVDYRFLDVNESFARLTGLKAKDIIGKTVLEVLPGTEKIWIEKYGRVALTREPIEFEDFSGELDKYYGIVAYSPQPNQFAVIITDITDRKQKEKQVNEQMNELQRWHNVTLGREDRIRELKIEVNQLLVKEGATIKYSSVEDEKNTDKSI